MALGEFDIVAQFFKKNTSRSDVVLGIGDDCAILQPPVHKNLVVSTDTLNVGTHFFPNASPYDIGYKSVAVSLSDIAAMGGEPAWLLLSLTLPDIDSSWLTAFSKGLFDCLNLYHVDLVGGNTTKGPLAITTQITGFVKPEHSLTRNQAKPGDHIFLTGQLGDAGLALAILKEEINSALFSKAEIENMMRRLSRPTPRINAGLMINSLAHAAIDVSDGLLADLGHILEESQVGATLCLNSIPTALYFEKLLPEQRMVYALTAGDDYELCFTLASENLSALNKIKSQFDCTLTNIGVVEQQSGLRIKYPDGTLLTFDRQGYKHF